MLSTIRSASPAAATARGPNAATVSVGGGSGGWVSRKPLWRPPSNSVRSTVTDEASRSAEPTRVVPCQRATTVLDVPSATWTRRPVAATVWAASAIWTGLRTVTGSGPSTSSIWAVRAAIVAASAGASALAISGTHSCR